MLGVILLEGGCAAEKVVWEYLSLIGVYPGKKHFIYGEPMELLTNVWVREHYLQYKLVPGSNPTYYQFLWGPRAHIEINKVEFIEYFAQGDQNSLRFLSQELGAKKREMDPEWV